MLTKKHFEAIAAMFRNTADTIEGLTLELEEFKDILAAAESRSDDYLGDLLALQEKLADKDDTIDELKAELKSLKEDQ